MRPSSFFLALCLMLVGASFAHAQDEGGAAHALDFAAISERANALAPLQTLLIAVEGETVFARGFGGARVESPHNIKSASKSIISALVGIAIERGVLEGVDQPIASVLEDSFPADPDPRLYDITIGNLLAMQAGLESTSGSTYGRWVSSGNWVRFALAQPFAADPGTQWQYSTGSTHLLSAILTQASGRSTLALAEDWLGPINGFDVAGWERDPQGIYLGGNQFAIAPRTLLAFGETYRRGGETADGSQIVPRDWVETSWRMQSRSYRRGDDYGYGWFLDTIAGHAVRYAWGYGGQMLYIVPELALTVAITSDDSVPSARTGYLGDLDALLTSIMEVVERGGDAAPAAPQAGNAARTQN